ncbi:acetyltransferase [Pseudarthrobacter oxydans]|uniref:acetyltransferase n=1 Tax=Pseudarthrobacter oxydans TaxID=1671 RepID=UPI0037FA5F0F
MKSVVVIGAGGFGREVLDILESLQQRSMTGLDILGVIDDGPSSISLSRLEDRGYAYLGPLDDWLERGIAAMYVVAIGNPVVRKRICSKIESFQALEAFTAVHPSAVMGSAVRLGKGTVICAGVNISTNVATGGHVHLNPGAIIGHDSILHSFVSVNPGAIVSGDVTLGEESLLGAGAVVLQGLAVGAGSTVGAGAVVTRDVGDNIVVKGVPAR